MKVECTMEVMIVSRSLSHKHWHCWAVIWCDEIIVLALKLWQVSRTFLPSNGPSRSYLECESREGVAREGRRESSGCWDVALTAQFISSELTHNSTPDSGSETNKIFLRTDSQIFLVQWWQQFREYKWNTKEDLHQVYREIFHCDILI